MAATPASKCCELTEPTKFDTWIAVKRGAPLSLYIEHYIDCLRSEMRAVGLARGAARKPAAAHAEKVNMMLCLPHNRVIVLVLAPRYPCADFA